MWVVPPWLLTVCRRHREGVSGCENALENASRVKLVHTRSKDAQPVSASSFVADLKGTMRMKEPAPSFDSGAGNSAVLGKGVSGGSRAASRSINDLMDQIKRHKQTAIASGVLTGARQGRRPLRSGKRAVSARERASGSPCGSQSCSFADNFEPYRRVISCDSDLLAHDLLSTSS